MTTATSPEMASLKSRLKSLWEAGDFSEIAKHIETTAADFVERLDIQPGTKVLDVACGSGNLAVLAAPKGADVTGVDIASNLVDSAKRRAESLGLNIRFDEGDAEDLPYEDNSFDLVMTMYGAMFAPRPDVVAGELVRVCKPGGRIAMANWTPDGFAGQMFKLSTKYLPPPDMPPPVQWGVPDIVRERFGDRVTDLTMTPRMAEMIFEYPPEDVVALFKKFFGPTVTTFKVLPEEHHQALTDDMVNLWTEHNTKSDGTTLTKSEYLEVMATKK